MSLEEEIKNLIETKQEGGYWDFKQEWHTENGELLHDIICLANNLCNKDAYLIFGVEDKTGKIFGVSGDPNRKNTQNLVDFLKDKKFAGSIRPFVMVETIVLENKELDILIIKNMQNTPFYLTDKYRGVFANQIYTRVNDTNTPITANADIDHVEYLWKKRFGINLSIFERLNVVLDDWQNWGAYINTMCESNFVQGGNWGECHYIFNRMHPEFRIEISFDKHHVWTKETMRCFYTNQTSGHYEAKIFFNNTELYSFLLAHVDEYRKYLVMPRTGSYNRVLRLKKKGNLAADYPFGVNFYYLTKDSIEGKIQRIITRNTFDTSSRNCLVDKYWLLLFDDDNDYANFVKYAEANVHLYETNLKNMEYCWGDEDCGANLKMVDSHNAYRAYVEYLIEIKRFDRSEFAEYFRLYGFMKDDE